jgi:integrase
VHLDAAGHQTKAVSHVKHLREMLGTIRASDLTTADVERYQRARLEAGRLPATISHECALLRQAFRRGARVKPRRVAEVPHIPLLKVENARQGFLSRADFEALAAKLEDTDVRDFVEWFWWTGMRPNEIRQLTWSMVDRETSTLNLDPRAAKTKRGRAIAIEGPLKVIMERRKAARRLDCSLIFHRMSKGQPGQPVKDFRLAWRAALKEANLPAGLVPYDLRRSALRNMVRGGTDYTVAMKISGHRTRSTFDRYNITSAEDIRAAILRTASYVATLPTERNVADIEDSQKTHKPAKAREAR